MRASKVLGELSHFKNPISAKSHSRIKSLLNTEQFDSFFNKPVAVVKATVKPSEWSFKLTYQKLMQYWLKIGVKNLIALIS